MTCKIVNIKNVNKYDVFIGRPSKWGNPFTIGSDGDRKEVIDKYRSWIKKQSTLMECLPELNNKTLACFCHPKPCHGDVLAELVSEIEQVDIF